MREGLHDDCRTPEGIDSSAFVAAQSMEGRQSLDIYVHSHIFDVAQKLVSEFRGDIAALLEQRYGMDQEVAHTIAVRITTATGLKYFQNMCATGYALRELEERIPMTEQQTTDNVIEGE